MAKYEEPKNDGVRKTLLKLAAVALLNAQEVESYKEKPTLVDVTGSLGCWGIEYNE